MGKDERISGDLWVEREIWAEGGIRLGSTSRLLKLLTATATWDPANLASAGDATSTTVTVAGAAVGDPVRVGLTTLLDVNALLAAHVQAANTVRVVLMNKTGGALNVAEGTVRVVVERWG